jgi:hypothetical protein
MLNTLIIKHNNLESKLGTPIFPKNFPEFLNGKTPFFSEEGLVSGKTLSYWIGGYL